MADKTIKVYWSQCGYREGNFGDKLTPAILDRLGVKYRWSRPDTAHLVGVGSLIEQVPEDYLGVIWTSGQLYEGTFKTFPDARVIAVRGRLTLERIRCPNHQAVCLGDGGLLSHLFYKPAPKRYKLGLVPHYVDFEDPIVSAIKSSSREITVIDVCAHLPDVIQHIGQCEHILSSSLHGLVVADSLHIPSVWMELNHGEIAVLGERFKFRDYFSVFGLQTLRPFIPAATDRVDTLLPLFADYSRPGIESVQQELLDSLQQVAAIPNHIDPRRAAADAAECKAWMEPLPEAMRTLQTLIPSKATFILADEDQFRHQMGKFSTLPFLEHEGQYWGPPPDAETGIAELERLRRGGAGFMVFAWPAFWWLDTYFEFRKYLEGHFPCVWRDERLIVYDLHATVAPSEANSPRLENEPVNSRT